MTVRHADVFASRLHSGAWQCSVVAGNARWCRTYYGYSKRDAIRCFLAYVRETA